MNIKEAIEDINSVLSCDCYYDETLAYQLTSYDIDWLKMAKEALEKQIPMKHHHTIVRECAGGEKIRTSVCPSCLGCILTVEDEYPRFCPWCGQAIDWEKQSFKR